jgi:hypothetical protein
MLGTPDGDWVSMAVPSDGSYGVPEGLISSFPCTTKDGEWSIVQGLDIDDFSRARISASVAELGEERTRSANSASSADRGVWPLAAWAGLISARFRGTAWLAGLALPVLIVLTIVVVLQPVSGRRHAASAAPVTERRVLNEATTKAAAAPSLGAMPKATTVRTVSDLSCQGTSPALALVSVHEQHVWLCELQRQVYSTAVTTGAAALGLGTRSGPAGIKQTNRYLTGPATATSSISGAVLGPAWLPRLTGRSCPTARLVTASTAGTARALPMSAMKWFYGRARVA